MANLRNCILTAAVVLGATGALDAEGGTDRMTGTFNLQVATPFVSEPGQCPPGTTLGTLCHARTTESPPLIEGLGYVTATYTILATHTGCPDGTGRALAYPARLRIAQRGDLNLALAEYPGCLEDAKVPASPQTFTVTGGSGAFAGASGTGTVTRTADPPGSRVLGVDTWTGTITVSGDIQLDHTPPTISGATAKVIRAPRNAKFARVRYHVTASDAVDGSVPTTCRPRSGSQFRLGRTLVGCVAKDAAQNTATARFTVTVKR